MISSKGATHEISEDSVKKWLDQVPMGRMGQPDEVAATVCFLLSSESSFVSGQILRVSGGEGD